jgi:hypothetical protein
MINIRQRSSGAASLITVIFISILLSIVVLGFVRIAINESRQSADYDLTSRAFYAAEAGLEDAKRALRSFLNGSVPLSDLNPDTCARPNGVNYDPELSSADEFDAAYTCMLIDPNPPNFEADLQATESMQIELQPEGGATFDKITIQWHIKADPPAGDGTNVVLRDAADTFLPKKNAWNDGGTNKYPSLMRTYLFYYPNVGINRASIDNESVAFLNPTVGGSTDYTYTPNDNRGIHNANCNTGVTVGEFVCKQVIYVSDSSSRNYILRLTSLYNATHIRVALSNGALPVNIEGVQAIVDVTGRAGDVFRRIEARLDIKSDASDYLTDYAFISADEFCKNMVVPEFTKPGLYQENDCDRPE